MDRNGRYLVYCQNGTDSSDDMAAWMVSLGFTNVYHLTGGLNSWTAAGYPTASGS